jgi:ABC-type branched-subunit amino acid transport system ATPase component
VSAVVANEPAEPLLQIDGLTKRFGGVVAVDRCTFSVGAGTITGLIGPNGSGKTTVFNMVTGYLPARGSADLSRPASTGTVCRARSSRRVCSRR